MSTQKSGVAVARGLFPPGTVVTLYEVAGPEVLRHTSGREVDKSRVPEDGDLVFDSGVGVGGRYIAFGYVDGVPTEQRLSGLVDEGAAPQASVTADVLKHADGIPVGEPRPDDPRITNVIDGLPAHTIDEAIAQPGGPRLHKGAQDGIAGGDAFGTHTTESEEAAGRTEANGETPDGSLRGEALEARIQELGIEGASRLSADEKRAAVAEAEKDRAAQE